MVLSECPIEATRTPIAVSFGWEAYSKSDSSAKIRQAAARRHVVRCVQLLNARRSFVSHNVALLNTLYTAARYADHANLVATAVTTAATAVAATRQWIAIIASPAATPQACPHAGAVTATAVHASAVVVARMAVVVAKMSHSSHTQWILVPVQPAAIGGVVSR
jgi:hypothetical protein